MANDLTIAGRRPISLMLESHEVSLAGSPTTMLVNSSPREIAALMPQATISLSQMGIAGPPGPPGTPGLILGAVNDNVGGVGVFKNEVGGVLHFYGISASNARITVTLDAGNSRIDLDIANNAVANVHLATMATMTIKGNNTGGAGNPIDLTAAQVKTLLAITQADVASLVGDLALKAPLASPALTGNPTAPTQAALNNSTRIATTAYVDAATTAIIAAADALVFKGVIDCSANPNYPAADRGHTYRVSVAGKIGGASGLNVEVGDLLLCLTDATASGNQATVGAQWSIAQTNIDGAVVGPASAVDSTPAVFDGATGKLIKNITFASFKTSLAIVSTDLSDFTEAVQDVMGGILTTSGDFTWTYNDGANTLSAVISNLAVSTGKLADNAVTYAKMQDISATQRIVARNTAGAGDPEEATISQVLNWISSTQGAIIYRDATGWVALAPGTSGQFLKTFGAAANPAWATLAGGGDMLGANNLSDVANASAAFNTISPLTTRGDIIFRNATVNARLPAGTSGYVLRTNGTGADPTWMQALGQQTIWYPAGAMTRRTTNGAANGSGETATNKVMRATLDFDPTTQQFAQAGIQMPKDWDGGTVICQTVWSHPATVTNFGVVWAVEAVAIADNEALDTAFGTAQTMTDTGGTTDRVYISPESAAITIANSPAGEKYVVFQVKRVPADAADTMAVVARLHGLKIHYTTNAMTDD